jgi:hypothetical protein
VAVVNFMIALKNTWVGFGVQSYKTASYGQLQTLNGITELLGFWTLSIVRILIVTRKKNKHDVSETGSVYVLR